MPAPSRAQPSWLDLSSASRRRDALLGLTMVSALAMSYVGAYQLRVLDHIACPAFAHGCAAVADAPFAHPFGVPDGVLGAAMYALLFALAWPRRRTRTLARATLTVAVLALLSNVLGIVDMVRFGATCFWCALTAVLAGPTVWLARARPHDTAEPPGRESRSVS